MVRTLALRSVVGTLAGMVAVTGLSAPAHAQTGAPAPLSNAGALVAWGTLPSATDPGAPVEAFTVPEILQGTAFSKVVGNSGFSVALTAAGKVVVLGESPAAGAFISAVPPSVQSATVIDIVSNGTWAGAITAGGRAVIWGQERGAPDPTDVPENLTDVVKLAIGGDGSAAAVKANGDVVMWGRTEGGEQTGKPENLGANVKALVGGSSHFYALKGDGNVVAWGSNDLGQTDLPASVSAGGNVAELESGDRTGLARLNGGSLAYWGHLTVSPDGPIFPAPLPIPASLDGKNVVKIAASEQKFLAVDDQGTVTIWATNSGLAFEMGSSVPAQLADAEIAGITWGQNFVIALVTKVLEVNKAAVAGTPTVGQTLTGTPATFSGAPDAATSQWLADGVAIGGATGTSLVLGPSHVGKRITFATTATKAGGEPFVSTSVPTGQVQSVVQQPPADPPKASRVPTFKANKVPTSKKKGKATVTVPAAAGRAKATGKATVTIKKGKTTKKISVSLSGGKKSISLPKLKKGTWKVQVSYNGDKNYLAKKSKTYSLKIKK